MTPQLLQSQGQRQGPPRDTPDSPSRHAGSDRYSGAGLDRSEPAPAPSPSATTNEVGIDMEPSEPSEKEKVTYSVEAHLPRRASTAPISPLSPLSQGPLACRRSALLACRPSAPLPATHDEGHGHDADHELDHGHTYVSPVERTQTITTSASNRPYSAFSTKTKWTIAILAGVAGLLSPISSNIFVPSIPMLAREFNRSNEDISLAMTIFLAFQAVTPSFFGAASDSYGRRPILMLTMVIYIGANIGLALMPTSKYWLLLFLRALQSIGGSAVISIGAGAISDIAEPRERGKFMAVFQSGAMIGPAFGPLLGGVFAETLGWRAIFWFLTILSCCIMVPVMFVFPETLRSIVGDGSIPPPTLNSSPIMIVQRRRMERQLSAAGLASEPVDRPPHKKYQPLSAFMILFSPEILIIFVVVSLPYLTFYCLLTVFSTALQDVYGLSELYIGLCYLPSGAGAILTTFLNGRQLDYYYRKEERRVGGDYRKRPDDFRVELARIRCLYPFISVLVLAAIGLGWALRYKAPLAVTLVLQFFVGLGTGTIGTATVYGQDILPGKGGAVSASLNLVRCAFGALGTGVIMIMYNDIGSGWTFVILGGCCVAFLPLSCLVILKGKQWRDWRADRAKNGGKFFKSEMEDNKTSRQEAKDEGPDIGLGDGR